MPSSKPATICKPTTRLTRLPVVILSKVNAGREPDFLYGFLMRHTYAHHAGYQMTDLDILVRQHHVIHLVSPNFWDSLKLGFGNCKPRATQTLIAV